MVNLTGSFVEQNSFVHNEEGDITDAEESALLGYSLTSGRYGGRTFIAAGAPRANGLRGLVTMSLSNTKKPFHIYKGNYFEGFMLGFRNYIYKNKPDNKYTDHFYFRPNFQAVRKLFWICSGYRGLGRGSN